MDNDFQKNNLEMEPQEIDNNVQPVDNGFFQITDQPVENNIETQPVMESVPEFPEQSVINSVPEMPEQQELNSEVIPNLSVGMEPQPIVDDAQVIQEQPIQNKSETEENKKSSSTKTILIAIITLIVIVVLVYFLINSK